MLEAFFLSLRTTEGVDIHGLEKRFGADFTGCFSQMCRSLKSQGLETLIQVSQERCTLTPKGQVFADTVNSVFADCVDTI